MKTYSQAFERQWSKLMYAFFDYLPTRYRQVSPHDWNVRRLIWGFKEGRNSLQVARLVADKMKRTFGKEAENIVFCCIPASSGAKNEIRYRDFSAEVCRLTGAVNAYDHIKVSGERLAIHESKSGKRVQNVQTVDFDTDFFRGKRILVFDDVLTLGFSYARFACRLETFGASVVGAFFLGRTLLLN